jgi:succinyl-CoA synthetase beta subunit
MIKTLKEKKRMEWIKSALAEGRRALSEYESKQVLKSYGIPVTREELAATREDAVSRARDLGYPVVLKACSHEMMHKSEAGGVCLNLTGDRDVETAWDRLTGLDGVSEVLVQEMVPGQRELVAGLIRDPSFGPCVMLGLGGVMTEVFKDTVFRTAPVHSDEAAEMVRELKSRDMLGPFRGQAAVNMDTLCAVLAAVGRIGLEQESVKEIDINPLIVLPDGTVKATDALVVLNRERTGLPLTEN